jgi:hypothetical protein
MDHKTTDHETTQPSLTRLCLPRAAKVGLRTEPNGRWAGSAPDMRLLLAAVLGVRAISDLKTECSRPNRGPRLFSFSAGRERVPSPIQNGQESKRTTVLPSQDCTVLPDKVQSSHSGLGLNVLELRTLLVMRRSNGTKGLSTDSWSVFRPVIRQRALIEALRSVSRYQQLLLLNECRIRAA